VRVLRVVILVLMFAAPGLSVVAELHPTAGVWRVIVNPLNPTVSVDRKFLTDAFLKKVTRWSHEDLIRPVDLRPDASTRRAFTDEVLKRSIAAVKNYWQQMVFSGRDVPPPELDSEQDVVKFVLKYPGAVGYVSSNANLEGTRALNVK
jgi:ABC-type phosphate transport system substrate-binding protein